MMTSARTRAAAIAATALLAGPVATQETPVNLSGVWWSGAPVPLLPGESPAMGMGMGMGTSTSPLVLTDEGQALMDDFDPADDPAVSCVQSGLVRTINSPYPIEIHQYDNRVTIEYEEWEVFRTIHLNGSLPDEYEPNPIGYSIGRYDDDALIVDSTGATRGLARMGDFFWTSEEVSTVERYSLTERGQLRLELDVMDPVMLAESLHYEKIWNPYDQPLLDFDCVLRDR
jgi:hypothetical protein